MNSILANIIKTVAPGLATLLGGPLAGGVVSLIGNLILGNPSASEQDITLALSNPANLVRLKEIEAQLDLAHLASSDKDKDRQVEVNKVEAASEGFFKSGARPAALWLSVIGWGYILVPICHTMGIPAVGINTDQITWLLGGLLGLGAFRTFEKVKGV